jgi:hypothetical protein
MRGQTFGIDRACLTQVTTGKNIDRRFALAQYDDCMKARRKNHQFRIPIPIPYNHELRQIAKIERRSIAQQGRVAIDKFVEQWRAALPSQDQARGKMSVKHSG